MEKYEIVKRDDITEYVHNQRHCSSDFPQILFAEINRKLYRRYFENDYYTGCTFDDWELTYHNVDKNFNYMPTTKSSVVCICGSPVFTLDYGEYEINGTCVYCGKRHIELYSG